MAMLGMMTASVRAENLDEAWAIAASVDQRVRSSGELQRSADESLLAARSVRLPHWHNASYNAVLAALRLRRVVGDF